MTPKCPYCLTDIRTWARKCHSCGEWIDDDFKKNSIQKNSIQNDWTSGVNITHIILWIIGSIFVLFFIILFTFIIWNNWDKIASLIPEKAIYNYKCNTSVEVEKEFNKNVSFICEKNNPQIRIQYKNKDIYLIDGQKLLEKCWNDQICDKENALKIDNNSETWWFILENNSISQNPSQYILAFVNKPSEVEKVQSLKSIFENFSMNFGDSVYIHILWTSKEPLSLEYKIPEFSVDVFNKSKNHEKTIILKLANIEKESNEFNYKKTLTFFNKTQFETQLSSYLGWLEIKNRETIALFDYINDEFVRLKNEKFKQKYFSFYINSYPTFPTIGYWRDLNEWSCNNWKALALKYNKDVDYRYSRCWNSGATGCIKWSKISWDYSYTYLSKISNLYPIPPEWNNISFIDIPGYDIEKIQNESCKTEINDALWKIKSNLITPSKL